MQAPVQVTVVEYVAEFFRKYKSKAYGKSISTNAKGGADALMGMLKLVLSKGGQDELRIALKCFKDQLTLALNSGPTRQQQLEELFALISSLIDAAERLRQFSPVKESISTAVLEEVRWRLYRIIVGDGFSDEPGIRRRALDITFQALHREQQEHQRSLARQQQLAAASRGILSSVSFGSDSSSSSPSKGRVKGPLHRKVVSSSLSGPDVSSWEGLWNSLASMSGKRMLPLLQSVMLDLYTGNYLPGSPAAAAAATPPATPSKLTTQPHKQQQQVLRQASNSSQVSTLSSGSSTATPTAAAAAAAAVNLTSAPSRSDTAGSIDVAVNNATVLHVPAAGPAAASSNVVDDVIAASSSSGLHSPTQQQHHDCDPAAAAGSQQQFMVQPALEASNRPSSDRRCSADETAVLGHGKAAADQEAAAADGMTSCKQQQQQYRTVRVSCTGSNNSGTESSGTNHALAAIGNSQPGLPEHADYVASSSSGCLGSPRVAAKRGGAAFVAKIRASVGGGNGAGSSSSSSGPSGWIPKGWVQFHHRDKSGGGWDSAAAAATGSSRHSGEGDANTTAADKATKGPSESSSEQRDMAIAEETPKVVVDSSDTAADAFAGEDVDWGSCNEDGSADGIVSATAAVAPVASRCP